VDYIYNDTSSTFGIFDFINLINRSSLDTISIILFAFLEYDILKPLWLLLNKGAYMLYEDNGNSNPVEIKPFLYRSDHI
jgi:hypothetical protein